MWQLLHKYYNVVLFCSFIHVRYLFSYVRYNMKVNKECRGRKRIYGGIISSGAMTVCARWPRIRVEAGLKNRSISVLLLFFFELGARVTSVIPWHKLPCRFSTFLNLWWFYRNGIDFIFLSKRVRSLLIVLLDLCSS